MKYEGLNVIHNSFISLSYNTSRGEEEMKKQYRILIWIGAIFVLLVIAARFVLPIFVEWQMPYYPHMFTGMMFPIGMLGMALFWGAVIYLVYKLLIEENQTKTKEHRHELSILKQRLAKGEISIEEYKEIKETIGGEEE